ncbi:MAG: peroxide stress protein YaaA [Thermosynechococcaceae cyanobacterium]
MLMVISPSKTLDFEGQRHSKYTVPVKLDQSQQLIDRLKTLNPEDISQLMGVSSKLADLNHKRYQTFQFPFTPANSRQALLAFKGDVYKGIEIDQYNDQDLDFAQKHLRILSGLYGILKPLDLIQPYRLEMGTKLVNESGQNLYEFWGHQIADNLNADFEQDERKTLVNLASNEYYKAIQLEHLQMSTLNIFFKENKKGTYKTIALFAKRARGLMVNYVIKNRLSEPNDLKAFDIEGYQFNPQLSRDQDWVFSRN